METAAKEATVPEAAATVEKAELTAPGPGSVSISLATLTLGVKSYRPSSRSRSSSCAARREVMEVIEAANSANQVRCSQHPVLFSTLAEASPLV